MPIVDVYSIQLRNAHDHILNVLNGLNVEQLNYRPNDNQHSVGFAIWHALRAWDDYYALITRALSVYDSDGWVQRFGFDPRGQGINGIGTGMTPDQVAALTMSVGPLCDFCEMLTTRTRASLVNTNDEVLLTQAVVPWWNPPTVTFARVLMHIVAHTYSHIGEAEYVRGLLGK